MSGARGLLTVFFALAFFTQAFITQTHVHGIPAKAGLTITASIASSLTGDKAPSPPPDSLTKCPLCQGVMAGMAVLGSTLLLLLEPTAEILAVETTVPKADTPSHVWQSRGPPRL